MEITIIIALVLYALAIVMAIKLIKNVLVAIGTILLISLLLMAGTGLFVYNEIDEMQQTFPVSNNLVLLTDGATVFSGAVILPSTEDVLHESIRFLEDAEIADLESHLAEEDYDAMRSVVSTSDFIDEDVMEAEDLLDETYKIFFIDMEVLENSPVEAIDLGALAGMDPAESIFLPIPREDSLEIIRSDDPWALLLNFVHVPTPDLEDLERQLEEQGFEILDETEDELNETIDETRQEVVDGLREGLEVQFGHADLPTMMFLLNLFSVMEQEGADGMMYLYRQYSDENIYIKDGSIIFDLLRLSPDALVTAVIRETHNAASSMGDRIADEVAEENLPVEDGDVDDGDDGIPDIDEIADMDEDEMDEALEELMEDA